MATLGSLAVAVRADPKGLVKGLRRAKKAVRSFTRSVPGLNAVFSKTTAIIGGLAAGGLAAFVKSQADAIDTTSKLADRLNATTEGLVGLQHAANISGSSTEGLNKSIEKMVRSIGQAEQGLMTQQRAFKLLGLEIDDLAGMKADEAFIEVADALSKVGNASDQAAIAADIFGRSGVELLNTLQLGRGGLEDMRREADELGLTFSRIDGKMVENANDAMTRAKAVIQGVGRTLAVELAPFIEVAARKFAEWAKSGGGVGSKVITVFKAVAATVGTVIDVFNVLKGVSKIAAGVIAFQFGHVLKVFGKLINALERAAEILTLGFVESDFGDRMASFADDVIGASVDVMKEGAADVASGFEGEAKERFLEGIREIQSEARKAAEEMQAITDAQRDAGGGAVDLEAVEAQRAAAKAAADEAARRAAEQERFAASMAQEISDRRVIATLGQEALDAQRQAEEVAKLEAIGREDLAEALREVLALEEERLAIDKAREEFEQREESIQRQQKAEAARLKALKAGRREMQREIEREIELMKAANDFERERIEIERELGDLIAGHAEDAELIAAAKERAAIKLAELAEREAKAAAEKAAAEQKITEQKTEQNRLIKKQADITKRFANFGGTSLFGFGAGQVGTGLGSITGDVRRAQQGASGFSGQGGGQGGGGSSPASEAIQGAADKIKSLSPEVQKVIETFRKIPPLWDQLGTKLGQLSQTTENGFEKTHRATEKAVETVSKSVRELDAKVRGFERRLNDAVNMGIGGR